MRFVTFIILELMMRLSGTREKTFEQPGVYDVLKYCKTVSEGGNLTECFPYFLSSPLVCTSCTEAFSLSCRLQFRIQDWIRGGILDRGHRPQDPIPQEAITFLVRALQETITCIVLAPQGPITYRAPTQNSTHESALVKQVILFVG